MRRGEKEEDGREREERGKGEVKEGFLFPNFNNSI